MPTTDTTSTYPGSLRRLAQSILEGVQRLEDLKARENDEAYSEPRAALEQADTDVWALVDHIEEGRPAL